MLLTICTISPLVSRSGHFFDFRQWKIKGKNYSLNLKSLASYSKEYKLCKNYMLVAI